MSVIPKRLSSLAPKTAPSFFLCDNTKCTKAFTKCATEEQEEDEYDWSIKLHCTVCQNVWWICRHCKIRKKMTTRTSLSRHQYSRHTKHDTSPSPSKRKRDVDDNPFRNMTDDDDITGRNINNEINDNGNNEIINVDEDDDGDKKVAAIATVINEDDDVKVEANGTENINNDVSEHVDHINENNNNVQDNSQDIMRIKRLSYFLKEDQTDNKNEIIRSKMIDHFMNKNEMHNVNENTANFYSHDIVSSGKKYLITKMWCKEESTTIDVLGRLTEQEVETQIKIGNFTRSLTRGQQMDFAHILNDINDVYFERKIKPICKLPNTFADVRRLYVDGTNSVTKNLPIPNIRVLNKHSYVSLMDCIADMLMSNDKLLNDIEDYNEVIELKRNDLSLFECERVKEIVNDAHERKKKEIEMLDSDVIVLFLKFWSDDFDPNNSIKSNRQSVWIQTVTIFAMTKDGNKISYTYPIATSAKGEDRDEVYQLLSDEVKKLQSGPMIHFFCRYSKNIAKIHADVYALLADQPERRNNLCLAAGNSKYHKRFGYLIDTNLCVNSIRACIECEKKILDKAATYIDQSYQVSDMSTSSDWRINPCNICSGWMTYEKHKLLMYAPDKNYPASKLDKTGKLAAKRITVKHLESCLEDVRLALKRSIWTPVTCKAYLRSEGFNTKATDDIVDYTINSITYKEAEDNKDDDPSKWKITRL